MKNIKSINEFLNKNIDKSEKINELLSTIPIDLSGKNTDKQILRVGILAELDAINLYEQMAEKTKNKKIKETLLDIAKEEKTHIGEFEALLLELDKEEEKSLKVGKNEVNNS